jgi:hypothetical protein
VSGQLFFLLRTNFHLRQGIILLGVTRPLRIGLKEKWKAHPRRWAFQRGE